MAKIDFEPIGDGIDFEPINFEPAEPDLEEIETSYAKQMLGALTRGGLSIGKAILQLPGHTLRLIGRLEQTPEEWRAEAAEIAAGKYGEKGKASLERIKYYTDAVKQHERGVEAILRAHPEWESEPAENFLDLVTSPRKLSLAVAESSPVLVGAGVMTAGGRPDLAMAMMFATEGQQAYDQAIADGQSADTAEQAYVMYGTVAAALENLQLQQFMKIGKGAYQGVLNRTVSKLANAKKFTPMLVKAAAQEAVEEMAQGTWSEATAYILYGKQPEGGLTAFLDRRAQEGLVAATMAGGSAAAGKAAGWAHVIGEKKSSSSEEIEARSAEIAAAIDQNPDLMPEQKAVMFEQMEQVLGQVQEITTEERQQAEQFVREQEQVVEPELTDAQKHALGTRAAKDLGADVPMKYVKAADKELAGLKPTERKAPKTFTKKWLASFYEKADTKHYPVVGDTWVLETGGVAEVTKISPRTTIAEGNIKTEVPGMVVDVMVRGKGKGRIFSLYLDKPLLTQKTGALETQAGFSDVSQFAQQQQKLSPEAQQILTEQQVQYDELLERAQAGDKKALTQLQNLVQEMNQPELAIPTYEELLDRASADDIEAITAIQQGQYRGGMAEAEAIELQRQGRITPPIKPETERALAFAKIKVHSIARHLGVQDKERKQIQQQLTGKKSMKDMTLEEANKVVDYFVNLGKQKGVITSTGEELAQLIKTAPPKRGWFQSKKWYKDLQELSTKYFLGMKRIERFLEWLDGGSEGPIYNTIWKTTAKQSVETRVSVNMRLEGFSEQVKEVFGDNRAALDQFLSTKQEVIVKASEAGPEVALSPSEKIGVYLYARQEDGLHHLKFGNFAEHTNPEAVIAEVVRSMTEQERAIADWIVEEIEQHYQRAEQAARIALGRELTKRDNYFGMRIDGVAEEDQTDFLTALLNKVSDPSRVSEPGEVKEVKKGAKQPLKLDALSNYVSHVQRIEQFIHMAPVAKQVGAIFNTREFRQAVNNVTNGLGMKTLDKWLMDTVRGYVPEQSTFLGKLMLTLRHRGVTAALAGNIPSVLRQYLSFTNAMAVHPNVMANIATNMATAADPRKYSAMKTEVMAKSKVMSARNFDRFFAKTGREKAVKMVVKGRKTWSEKALTFQRMADRYTTVLSWKGLYDAALNSEAVQKQFGLNGSEEAAIDFADKWIGRTQPMGDVEHLSDFFRGEVHEKLLTTFQNQVNNNWNFWAYDILGATKRGQITPTQATYRVMVSYIIPGLIFGMISRGRLPKSWKEVIFDEAVYGLGPFFLIGRVVTNALQGFTGGQVGVEVMVPVEWGKGIQSAVRGDWGGVLTHGAKGTSGLIGFPLQILRTMEGMRDLYTGETEDLRRLIWSKWSLKESEKPSEPVRGAPGRSTSGGRRGAPGRK